MDLDVLSEVLEYLTPADIYKLSLTNKYYHKHINVDEYIMKEIDKRLINIFGDNIAKFRNLLISVNAVISGSFIIQCILGKRWTDSDIDIFIPYTLNLDLEDFLLNDMKSIQIWDNYDQKYLLFSEAINYKIKSGQRIQLIRLNEGCFIEFMNKSFDFDICKNMYDTKNIKIKNLYSITHRTVDLQRVYIKENTGVRCNKYHERGFKFINKDLINLKDIKIYRTSTSKNDKYDTIPDNIMQKYPYISEFTCDEYCSYTFLFGKHKHIADRRMSLNYPGFSNTNYILLT